MATNPQNATAYLPNSASPHRPASQLPAQNPIPECIDQKWV